MRHTQFPKLSSLMDNREPVCITFEQEAGESYDLLYCEMVHLASLGRTFRASSQSCSAGDYILGRSATSPSDYYFHSGRYIDPKIAAKAASSLPRLEIGFDSVRIEPLSANNGKFNVLILYLNPEKAMRMVQALAYITGERTIIDTIGAASICGDCTVIALQKGIGLSFGCKGSRKHSGYITEEVPLGINYENVVKIEKGLERIPLTMA